MGHKFSKNQRTLNIADKTTTKIQDQNYLDQLEKEQNKHNSSVLITGTTAAETDIPRSVVITIRMLKMERRKSNQINNLNQCFKSAACMIFPSMVQKSCSNHTDQCCQSHHLQDYHHPQLASAKCLHCPCTNMQQTNQSYQCPGCRHQLNNLENQNFNVTGESDASTVNDMIDDQSDKSNILAQDNQNNDDNSNKLLDKSNSFSNLSRNSCNNIIRNCDNKSNCNNGIASTSSTELLAASYVKDNQNKMEIDNSNMNGNNKDNSLASERNESNKMQEVVVVVHNNDGGCDDQHQNDHSNQNLLNNQQQQQLITTNRCSIDKLQSSERPEHNRSLDIDRIERCPPQEDNTLERKSQKSPVFTPKWNNCCKLCNMCKDETDNKKSDWNLKFNCAQLKYTKPTTISMSNVIKSIGLFKTDVLTEHCTCNDQHQQQSIDNSQLQSSISVAATSETIANLSNSSLFDNSLVTNTSTIHTEHGNLILVPTSPLLDFSKFNPDEYPIEDCDEKARLQRALEIVEGVEPPPGFQPSKHTITNVDHRYYHHLHHLQQQQHNHHHHHLHPQVQQHSNDSNNVTVQSSLPNISKNVGQSITSPHWLLCSNDQTALNIVLQNLLHQNPGDIPRLVHSQVDYIHCLVPDLKKITNSCFYWGKMDRYEAERLLEGKPEGTFLLRDSAQEEFLFSVSFRKYGRSLHARIEQFMHEFSFDCHDPGVYTSSTVTGLLEHYKDPACVMFFEPALTLPLNRNFCFSLQQLCRATIVSNCTYDGINQLTLPATLKSYLKEYHYKQRVRINRFDEPFYSSS